MKRRPRVALLIETSNSYCRGLLRGIHAYVQEHGPWSTYLTEQGRGDPTHKWVLENLHGDGIIARIENRRIAEAVMELGLPVVDVSAARTFADVPYVETDDPSIACLGAEHLLGRGFKQFAFCGDNRYNWSLWREKEFERFFKERGCPCFVYRSEQFGKRMPSNVAEVETQLSKWIKQLPKPIGVMACYDLRGLQLLEVCRRLGVVVPDEMAVIGVDNDELLCNLSDPPLSSVIPNTQRTGYVAASMLDRLMAGRKLPAKSQRIEPLGTVTRQSTDVLTVADQDISQAVRYIREHACDGIKVEDVLKAVPLSRRVLEHRFRQLFGHTPHDEILRVQFQLVTQLLVETSLSLATVARRAGFEHAEYLSVAFKRRFGMPPSEYRKQHRR